MINTTIKEASEIIKEDYESTLPEEIVFERLRIPLPIFREQVRLKEMKILDLENEMDELKDELQSLKNSINKNVIFVKEVPFENAKTMVLNFIRQHKEGIYTVDIAKNLNLDIGVVLKAVSELKKENKIGKSDEGD